jgi:photosystem II stability/assembly factor-like uncharacterized protein/tetratricopeptide (TPR) repeat protein
MVGLTARIVGEIARAGARAVCAIFFVALFSSGAIAASPGEPQESRDPAVNDALLRDVTFVDAKQGWTVGDRGVIWHTADGGHRWELQTSGVDCPLSAVEFIDARHGWAAGGWTKPFSHATHGVWLETRDGGEHWRSDRNLLLPALRAIKFFDHQHGWAVARSSSLFPTGVFTTQDGGQSWSALSSTAGEKPNEKLNPNAGPKADGQTLTGASWLAGDFSDPLTGVLAGRTSALATVRRHGIEPARTADFGLRMLHRVRLVNETEGWLAGDGGLVLHTPDLGRTWQSPEGELPSGAAEHFDFQALAARASADGSQRCWIAGSPGTRVFFTADGGRNWQTGTTGQTLPLRDLTFVDDWHGWAVGDLGLILATEDGGRTWQRQQSGGGRAALAGFYAHATEVPWELLAQLSGDEGYLSSIQIVTRAGSEAAVDGDADLPDAAHEAILGAGGSAAETAWQFPVREPGVRLSAGGLVDDWNRANDGHALERLDAYLVRQIRIWRPSVVVIAGSTAPQPGDKPGNKATSPARSVPLVVGAESSVIAQAVLSAVERAADPTRHSGQIVSAGLQPWKVDKVFSALPDGQMGMVTVNTAQVSTRARRPLAEVAQTARGLVASTGGGLDYQAPTATRGFRMLVNRLPQDAGTHDFFSGIGIAPGSEARRQLSPGSGQGVEPLKRMAQSRRNLQAILAQAESAQPQAGHWLAEIGQMVRSLDESSAGELLFQLGERYYHQGRWELAAEAFQMVANRYPQHPLAGASLVWLVQYYASGEAAWRLRQTDRLTAEQVSAVEPIHSEDGPRGKKAERIVTATRGPNAPARQIATQGGLIGGTDQAAARAQQAATLAKRLNEVEAALLAEPRVGFPLAIAHRRQGYPRQAERFYTSLCRTRPHDAWWAAADCESWLPVRHGLPSKSVASCVRTAAKPRLDGQLDDAVWRTIRPLELHSKGRDDASWSAVAMLAYDEEFLYLAASCRQIESIRRADIQKRREHDADVSWQDRIEICLDTDRDWTTFYRLSIDQRGCTHDECWHDATWNPHWFVAAARQDDVWTVEAAIPLVELARDFPTAGQAWALGVTRIAPGVGLQSWTAPAGAEPVGEGFGLLLFE